jgi:hypothetical protein
MPRYYANCRTDNTARNTHDSAIFTRLRNNLAQFRFLIYSIIGQSFLQDGPEVVFNIHQKCLTGYNIYRMFPFIIKNDSDRQYTRAEDIKSESRLRFFLISI